jgi:hypothetical protein
MSGRDGGEWSECLLEDLYKICTGVKTQQVGGIRR